MKKCQSSGLPVHIRRAHGRSPARGSRWRHGDGARTGCKQTQEMPDGMKEMPHVAGTSQFWGHHKPTLADKEDGGGLREYRLGVGRARFVRNRPCLHPDAA